MITDAEQFIIDVLREQDTRLVFKQFPTDKTPCITLDNSRGSRKIRSYRVHDPYERIITTYESTIRIHIWANSETERHDILSDIDELFTLLDSDYYELCCNYDGGRCYAQDGAPACDVLYCTDGRSCKKQCPRTDLYLNLFRKYNIDRNAFTYNLAYNGDDRTATPTLYHSVIDFEITWDKITTLSGKINKDIDLGDINYGKEED